MNQLYLHIYPLFFFRFYSHIDLYRASQVVLVVKNLPANAGNSRDEGSIPGLRRSLGEGNGNLLQYSCLENSLDTGAWLTTAHGVSKNLTRLRDSLLMLVPSAGGEE